MKLPKRAEQAGDRSKLLETFVDVGTLFTLLTNKDHQVLYGRRGTGKTHVLSYLEGIRRKQGDCAIYIDMRTVGSTGGIYSDTSLPTTQRATRLLADTLGAIQYGLYEYFVERSEESNFAQAGPLLDHLADAITEVAVKGTVEKEQTTSDNMEDSGSLNAELSAGTTGAGLKIGGSAGQKETLQVGRRLTETGVAEYRIHFGSVGHYFNALARVILPHRTWILLDEWSSVPRDLQPLLADLLRRAIFPVPNFTVKIATIEQRSRFRISKAPDEHIGIELGADIGAELNLDDFMVFDTNRERAKLFFKELLFKHVRAIEDIDLSLIPQTADELIRQGFTQRNAFDEFVRATEGVSRDAFYILGQAAQRALDAPISVNDIRGAASRWYQQDKEATLRSYDKARDLLHWIIDIVIGQRRARAFLLRTGPTPELIDFLFDERLLHLLKRNVSSRDEPGARYDVYKLDFGCYVDLITTQKATKSLLGDSVEEDDNDSDVPLDDYRAIRRAILDIDAFLKDYDKPKGYQLRLM